MHAVVPCACASRKTFALPCQLSICAAGIETHQRMLLLVARKNTEGLVHCMFPHVRDIEGRKVNVGKLGLRTARRAKVRGNLPHVSS